MQTVSWQKNDAIPILDGKERHFKEAGERREYRQRLRVKSLPVFDNIERFWVLSRSAIECWDTCIGGGFLESQCFFHQKNRDAAWPFPLDQEYLRREAARPIEGLHPLVLQGITIFPD